MSAEVGTAREGMRLVARILRGVFPLRIIVIASTRPIVVCADVHGELYGAQLSLLHLYAHWQQERRYNIHFVALRDGPLCEAFHDMGAATTVLRVGRLLGSYNKKLLNLRSWDYAPLARELYSFARLLKKLLREQQALLLHCNDDRVGLMSFVAAHWVGCPIVTHIRRDRSFGRLDKLIYYGADEIIWVSRRVRDEFAARIGVAQPKGRVIYNGRELGDVDEHRTDSALREEFCLPDNALIALVLAGFDVRKDHETLVAAADIACRQEPRLYILLAGEDTTPDQSRRQLIERMVSERGLTDRVRFLGHRNDAGRLLRGADILINTAREEALGGALIEATAYGVPVVATDAGGTAEIVVDAQSGFVVPRGDDQAVAERALTLLGDATMRTRFGARARAHFAQCFTVATCASETAAFFDAVIAGGGRLKSTVDDPP